MPRSSSARIAPMCAQPRALPEPRASPMRGLRDMAGDFIRLTGAARPVHGRAKRSAVAALIACGAPEGTSSDYALFHLHRDAIVDVRLGARYRRAPRRAVDVPGFRARWITTSCGRVAPEELHVCRENKFRPKNVAS